MQMDPPVYAGGLITSYSKATPWGSFSANGRRGLCIPEDFEVTGISDLFCLYSRRRARSWRNPPCKRGAAPTNAGDTWTSRGRLLPEGLGGLAGRQHRIHSGRDRSYSVFGGCGPGRRRPLAHMGCGIELPDFLRSASISGPGLICAASLAFSAAMFSSNGARIDGDGA
jgi:hypothetical protein